MTDTVERKVDPANIALPKSRNPSAVPGSPSTSYPMSLNSVPSLPGRSTVSGSLSRPGTDEGPSPTKPDPTSMSTSSSIPPNVMLNHKDSFGQYDVSAQPSTPEPALPSLPVTSSSRQLHSTLPFPEDVLDTSIVSDQEAQFVTGDSSFAESTLNPSHYGSTIDNGPIMASPTKSVTRPERTSSLSQNQTPQARVIPGARAASLLHDSPSLSGHSGDTHMATADVTLGVAPSRPSTIPLRSPMTQMQTLSSTVADSIVKRTASTSSSAEPVLSPVRPNTDAPSTLGSAASANLLPALSRDALQNNIDEAGNEPKVAKRTSSNLRGQRQVPPPPSSSQANGAVTTDNAATVRTPHASTMTTTVSTSRPPRLPGARIVPQLPSAQNVAPAPPPAMYWSKVPVHGTVPRRSFRAHSACLADEVMWLFGGCDAKGCFHDLYCFDTETMCWSKPKITGDVPPARRAHSATMVDKRLYVFAGGDGPYYFNDLYVFDTIALRWIKPDVFGQPPSPRRAHTSSYYDGQLIIFGGGNGVGALNDVYSLDVTDLNRLEWRKIECRGKVPIGRGYHTSNLVDGKLIVIGGSDGHMSFDDIHILRLDTRTWYQVKTEDVHNRLGHTATQVGSYLFIVGGHDSHSYTPDILTLNLVNLQWEARTVCGRKPPGRGYHQAWLHDGRLFVHGGFDGKEIYDDLYYIDLSACAYLPQITSFSVELDDE